MHIRVIEVMHVRLFKINIHSILHIQQQHMQSIQLLYQCRRTNQGQNKLLCSVHIHMGRIRSDRFHVHPLHIKLLLHKLKNPPIGGFLFIQNIGGKHSSVPSTQHAYSPLPISVRYSPAQHPSASGALPSAHISTDSSITSATGTAYSSAGAG